MQYISTEERNDLIKQYINGETLLEVYFNSKWVPITRSNINLAFEHTYFLRPRMAEQEPSPLQKLLGELERVQTNLEQYSYEIHRVSAEIETLIDKYSEKEKD
jgi:hypothetical protein